MSDATTIAAIQAIRDRLDGQVKGEAQLGHAYMNDYELDPFTRTDAMCSLGQDFEDDAEDTYGELARSAGVEDTWGFRKAVDTRFNAEWANRDDNDDGWDEAGHQAWLDDMGHVNDDEDGDVR